MESALFPAGCPSYLQFTSQKSPDEIMEAIEVAVGSLGGTPVRLGGGNK
jgi:hypothetical protein